MQRPVTTAAVVLLAGAMVALGAPAALADAPVDQGWWTVTNAGAPAPAPVITPPDVPAEGLLVQGGAPGSPVAFAGLIFEPAPGSIPQRLVLAVAPQSATTPAAVLQLCPLTDPYLNAERGGPIADAPAYDCKRSVTGKPDDAGTSYVFDLKALGSSGGLAVAVLPTSPSDRVVFAAPGADSLVTAPAPVAFSPAPFPSDPEVAPPGGPGVAPLPAVGTAELPASVPSIAPPPALAQEPSLAPAPTKAPALASVIPTTEAAAATGDHHGVAGAALLGLLALGAVLWAFAGRGPGLDPSDP